MSQAPTPPGVADLPDLGPLSDLAPELARTFVTIASDIALVIDANGVIRNVALGQDPISNAAAGWVGQRWADTVTGDTQRKVEQLMSEVRSAGVTRRREVSHLNLGGSEVPVAYAAVRLGRDGPVLAVGRDLRAVAAIQQRFVETQQELERDYWRQRQAESRHRLLLQAAHDAVLAVDAADLRVLHANPAAGLLLGVAPMALAGLTLTDLVTPASRPSVRELLIMARATGRPAEMRAHLAMLDGANPGMLADTVERIVDLSATPLRVDEHMHLLVRARVALGAGGVLAELAQSAPDGVVVTDPSGRMLAANAVFLARHGLASDADVANRPLADWLGPAAPLLAPLLAQARLEGLAEQRHHSGLVMAAALLTEGDQECIGITLHRGGILPAHLPPQAAEMALAVDRLARQIGVATLPDLLLEASDLAERHFIEAALARTEGDPRQAALLLGIGLDHLWQRMRHHRINTLAGPGAGTPPNLLN